MDKGNQVLSKSKRKEIMKLGCCRIYQKFCNYTTEAKEIGDEGSTT